MKNSIITLLTDFGTKDHYVASMKGVILGINPGCTLVDITHHVSPQDIKGGAFLLANGYSYFPKGTIHLCVVDPGVGSPRKPILLVTSNYFFIGPDNGLFTFILQRERVKQVLALTNQKYFLTQVSTTFHGRDLFAPVAGHLSLGLKPMAFGHPLHYLTEINFEKPKVNQGKLLGEILHIDAFGNLISNINEKELLTFAKGLSLKIQIGERVIQGLKKGYWEERRNAPMAFLGSSGYLEISVREGSAKKILRARIGDKIQVKTLIKR